jgi:hypothetical protein
MDVNKELNDNFIDQCYRNNEFKTREYETYTYIVFLVLLGTLFMIIVGFIYTIGPKKLCIQLFFIFSLHWFFVLIIKCRLGMSLTESIEKPIKSIVENDEEIAQAMCNSENDEIEPTIEEKKAEMLNKSKKQQKRASKGDWKNIEAKEKIKARRRLDEQYRNCLENDQIGNDDGKIAYEESSQKMKIAIAVLKIK